MLNVPDLCVDYGVLHPLHETKSGAREQGCKCGEAHQTQVVCQDPDSQQRLTTLLVACDKYTAIRILLGQTRRPDAGQHLQPRCGTCSA